jgi:signal transduction histidine kinase
MTTRLTPASLLPKLLLSTSIALTILFAATGWILQRHVISITEQTVGEETSAAFKAYQSLWQSRAEQLASTSKILSRMDAVRGAFSTGDPMTIKDTAGELWQNNSRQDAIFIVADPGGRVIALLGRTPEAGDWRELSVVRDATSRFPDQSSGFMTNGGRLYQITVTPVYVQATEGQALLDVLVAGYAVDSSAAQELKNATGGSDFLFTADGRVMASTLDSALTRQLQAFHPSVDGVQTVQVGDAQNVVLVDPLKNLQGRPIGDLRVVRSFEGARQRIRQLRKDVMQIWLAALIFALALTWLLAQKILGPVERLDRAAAEFARGNFKHQVEIESADEIGRLAATFNAMGASIESARQELIRQERIATIGRLSTSIVHDLRNPLAAIYGGAEMLVDRELSSDQVRRLAKNIYRSSRTIQELLQDLVGVAGGKTQAFEPCRLRDIVVAANQAYTAIEEAQSIAVEVNIDEAQEVSVQRFRMERVFLNLIGNAVEAMSGGGTLRISARPDGAFLEIAVADNGPGISTQIRDSLFQPFVSFGKANGLGLGLSFSRQTLLDHGGDLFLDPTATCGARFVMKVPLDRTASDEMKDDSDPARAGNAVIVRPPVGPQSYGPARK